CSFVVIVHHLAEGNFGFGFSGGGFYSRRIHGTQTSGFKEAAPCFRPIYVCIWKSSQTMHGPSRLNTVTFRHRFFLSVFNPAFLSFPSAIGSHNYQQLNKNHKRRLPAAVVVSGLLAIDLLNEECDDSAVAGDGDGRIFCKPIVYGIQTWKIYLGPMFFTIDLPVCRETYHIATTFIINIPLQRAGSRLLGTVENSTIYGFRRSLQSGVADRIIGITVEEEKKEAEISSALLRNGQVQLMPVQVVEMERDRNLVIIDLSSLFNGSLIRGSESNGALACGLASITVDKAVEFSYEELSKATNDFSIGYKIGQGGFGAVYYAELRGEKAAIKKMDMLASKEFLAELNVLTHVHHLNLCLKVAKRAGRVGWEWVKSDMNLALAIFHKNESNKLKDESEHEMMKTGLLRSSRYCVEGSHFLVYEYIENGNLSQQLHGSGREPLPWTARVQIALDSARGLEYIHEYTVSVFIHCDIKSANILIDRNFRGKVADFGLTRLTEVGSRSRLVGTFGYMSPEYAQYGDVSPKVDVYAFGVVLYELISAKKAIIRENGSDGEPKGLIALFDEVFSQANPEDGLVKMIDPRLGDNYSLDSVYKIAQLAKACTHEDPQRRPHMRSVVVALTNLASS
ncbi:hypothetical protein M8C21_028419, partial [Ambrosia artemisiifolia]